MFKVEIDVNSTVSMSTFCRDFISALKTYDDETQQVHDTQKWSNKE